MNSGPQEQGLPVKQVPGVWSGGGRGLVSKTLFLKKKLFIFALLGLHGCTWAFSRLLIMILLLLRSMDQSSRASVVVVPFNSRGSCGQSPRGMWDPPDPDIETLQRRGGSQPLDHQGSPTKSLLALQASCPQEGHKQSRCRRGFSKSPASGQRLLFPRYRDDISLGSLSAFKYRIHLTQGMLSMLSPYIFL